MTSTQPISAQTLLTGLRFPEGPAFAPDGSLWAVELKGESLIRWQDGHLRRYAVGGSPNGIAIDARGRIWFCDSTANAIRQFNPATGQVAVMADALAGQPLHKPNDLAFDRAGNLVFTCPGESRKEPTGYVGVLTPDGSVRLVVAEKQFPNGLAFSADGRELILAETYRHRLWRGDWNPQTARWTNARVWAEVGGPIGPDGMAFAQNGDLYVAVYGSGRIKVVLPNGRIGQEIGLPGQNPTNCAFDPTGKQGLVVTEAEHGLLVSLNVAAAGSLLFDGTVWT